MRLSAVHGLAVRIRRIRAVLKGTGESREAEKGC